MNQNSTLILRKILFIAICFISISQSAAQNITVTFKVTNSKKEPVTFATISVASRTDSTQIIKKVADSSGMAKFNLTKGGQYNVNITSVNYQPIDKGIILSGNQSFFSFVAERLPKNMEAVVVTSKKPLITQEDDKTIVDPQSLADASTSGYEVIEKTPGLFVDQDGNIYISSLTPIRRHLPRVTGRPAIHR